MRDAAEYRVSMAKDLAMSASPRAVVFVTGDFPPDSGGLQRTTERLAVAVRQLDVAPIVVAPKTVGDRDYDGRLPFEVRRYRRAGRLGVIMAMAREMRLAVAESGAERVVAITWHPAGTAAKLARLRGMKAAITVITHGSEIAHQRGTLRRMALRAVMRGVDIVSVSRYTAGLLRRRGIDGARVVNPGADPVHAAPRERAQRPTILSVGRLVRRKGVDRLIEAMPALAARFPDVELVVVGEGPDRERLEQLSASLGMASRVRFVGAVSDDALARHYAAAWCFAMPNRREGDDVEGFGLVFLEAALHGLPAIGGRDSGADDAIVDGTTGYLVDGNDVRDLERALIALLDDPQRCERFGAAARSRARTEFTWSRYASALLQPRPDSGRTPGQEE